MPLTQYAPKLWKNRRDPTHDANVDPELEALELNRIDNGIAAVTSELLAHEANVLKLTVTFPSAVGDGVADDTAALNAVIASSPGRRLIGYPGKTYLISAPLVLSDGQTLDMIGCTVNLKAGSNCNMVKNAAAVAAQRAVADGAMTSGSAVLTSATAAFSAADVGRSVYVNGAIVGGYRLVAKVLSVTNATTIVLNKAASATVAGAAVSIFNRNKNIAVRGGIWNNGNNLGTGTDSMAIFFRHVDKLTVTDLTPLSTNGKGICPGDCTNITIERISEANTLSDVVHVQGPVTGVRVADISGAAGDDFVAFTGQDYPLPSIGDTAGDITGVDVQNLRPTACLSVVKMIGGPAGGVQHGEIDGIFGSPSAGSQGAVWIGNDTSQASTTGGFFDDITIGKISVTPVAPASTPNVFLNGTNYGAIRIKGIDFDGQNSTGVPVNIAPSAPTTIGSIDIEKVRVKNQGAAAIVAINGNATIGVLRLDKVDVPNMVTSTQLVRILPGALVTLLEINDCDVVNTTSAGWMVYNQGTITKMVVKGGSLKGTVAGITYLNNLGTVTSVVLDDIQATLTGASSLVTNVAGTATAVITEAVVSGTQIGGSSVISSPTAGQVVGSVTIAGLVQDGASWLADLNTVTVLMLAGIHQKNATSGAVNVRSSGQVTIRGGGSLSAGITNAGQVQSQSYDVRCDVAQLTMHLGDLAYNTNAGTPPGVGPVICDGTRWVQAWTGAVKTGTATLVGGTVVVNDAAITANSIIRVSRRSVSGTPGALYISALTAGVSFAITSTNAADTSSVYYEVVSY